jgi:hypothetical protein
MKPMVVEDDDDDDDDDDIGLGATRSGSTGNYVQRSARQLSSNPPPKDHSLKSLSTEKREKKRQINKKIQGL